MPSSSTRAARSICSTCPTARCSSCSRGPTHFNKGETAANLKDLGSQFKQLPPGWKFRVKVLERDLTVAPKKPPNYLAWVTQDEFWNTYQGCGYDETCNYVP